MGYRTIKVDNKDYDYVVGNTFVKIKPPQGKSKVVPIHKLLGISAMELADARWEGSNVCAVQPSHIARFIRNNF